jgi:hypothetical protein
MIQDAGEIATHRVMPVVDSGSWLADGGAAGCARGGTGSDRAGAPAFPMTGTGRIVRRVRRRRTAAASRPDVGTIGSLARTMARAGGIAPSAGQIE